MSLSRRDFLKSAALLAGMGGAARAVPPHMLPLVSGVVIPRPALDFVGGQNMFSDAGTTPAADTVAIQQWTNNGTLGGYLTQGTANDRPIYEASTKAAKFVSSDKLDLNASWAFGGGGITVVVTAYCPWTTGAYRAFFASGYTTNAGIGFVTTGTVVQDWQAKDLLFAGNGYLSTQTPRVIASYGAIANNTIHTIAATLSPTMAEIYMDGVRLVPRVSTPGAVAAITATPTIGYGAITGDPFDGGIIRPMVFPLGATHAQLKYLSRNPL